MYQYRSWVFKNDIHDDFYFDYDATEEFINKKNQKQWSVKICYLKVKLDKLNNYLIMAAIRTLLTTVVSVCLVYFGYLKFKEINKQEAQVVMFTAHN